MNEILKDIGIPKVKKSGIRKLKWIYIKIFHNYNKSNNYI